MALPLIVWLRMYGGLELLSSGIGDITGVHNTVSDDDYDNALGF